jgi:hypothetical protein
MSRLICRTRDEEQAELQDERNRKEYGGFCADCAEVEMCNHDPADCPHEIDMLFSGSVDLYRRRSLPFWNWNEWTDTRKEMVRWFFDAGFEAAANLAMKNLHK